MKIEKLEELESWKAAKELVKNIFILTISESFRKDFGLRDQIQRAAVSIMTNISEGFDSRSDKSFNNHQSLSFGSVSRVESLLYVALDQEYILKSDFEELYKSLQRIKSLIEGTVRCLSKTTSNVERRTSDIEHL